MSVVFLDLGYAWGVEQMGLWAGSGLAVVGYAGPGIGVTMGMFQASDFGMDPDFLPFTKSRCFIGITSFKNQGIIGPF